MNRDQQFLIDMLLSAKIAVSYIQEKSKTDLEKTQSGLPVIPWRLINGMRNRLVHEYDDIDLDTVWDTLEKSLPNLISELEKITSSDL